MIASNVVILHHLTSVMSCYFMVCPPTLLSRGPPSWMCVDSNPNKDRNQSNPATRIATQTPVPFIFLSFFRCIYGRPYYTHIKMMGWLYLFIFQLYKSHNKKQQNVDRYITIFRYQMLELWATSLFDNGYICFYIPTMESFAKGANWTHLQPLQDFSSFSKFLHRFLPCFSLGEPQDLKSQRPSVPATRALRTLHSALEVVGQKQMRQGILQFSWPFISYKYWTNPIYRMYNPIEITSYNW